ncbi:MAG: sulfatase activating formylglycine-generating enzyme [Verrucomicrobiales bacterium]|jgi:formylglycine-generating enzyme required for sulfatase activity
MILLTVDEDPKVIAHTLGVLKSLGGNHEVHTASNLSVAENSATKLEALDVLIVPAIASTGENFFGLRDSLRARFPKLHVLFLNDYDVSDYQVQIGADTVLARLPEPKALSAWAHSIGFDTLPSAPAGPLDPEWEPLLEGSPEEIGKKKVPVAVASVPENDGADDEQLPVAGFVAPAADRLGDYKLVRVIASHPETETHEAVQLSIGRTVALVQLKPEFCDDREALREFRGAVRAKAAVSHPYITPVYEAHEEEGSIFYTRELVEGLNLPQLASTGKKITQRTLIQIIRTTAECLKFMRSHGIKRSGLKPRHVYLGQDAQVRVNNIATLNSTKKIHQSAEIAELGASIEPLVSDKPSESDYILPLLERMRRGDFERWENLLEEAHELENRVEDAQTYSVSGRTSLNTPATSNRALSLVALAALGIAALVAFVVIPSWNKPKPLAEVDMPLVPAGEFIFLDGEKRTTKKPFWIDKYEVTISQYAEFLLALATEPIDAFDHPDQAEQAPDKLGHTPDDWDVYYAAAQNGGDYQGSPIDLNCPVMLVDWWDAHAYAKWKDHRLPTEEEWSKAARGAEGNIYPWGNSLDYTRFNSSAARDRFSKWSPVDAMPEDVSPFGVVATCGNVSEWTATTDTHPEFFDRTVPVVRGGNFASPEDRYPLTDRRHAESANDRSVHTGFRTVSDTDPSLEE